MGDQPYAQPPPSLRKNNRQCLFKKWLGESRAALDATAQWEIPASAAKRNARTQPVLWSLQTDVLRLLPLL